MAKFIEFDLDTITSNLDKYCKEAIYTHYSEIKLIKVSEDVSHDGYDREGPQSNLFDLSVLYCSQGNYYLDQWHREDWFCLKEPEPYSLFARYRLEESLVEKLVNSTDNKIEVSNNNSILVNSIYEKHSKPFIKPI